MPAPLFIAPLMSNIATEPLEVSINPPLITEGIFEFDANHIYTTEPLTAQVTGGVPPYSYSWTTNLTVAPNQPTSQTTTYDLTNPPASFTNYTLGCEVTDSTGTTALALSVLTYYNGTEGSLLP